MPVMLCATATLVLVSANSHGGPPVQKGVGGVRSAESSLPGPCDLYAQGGTPCVAAHSVVRALYAAYDGPLYQVVRTTDKSSINVSTIAPGSYADAAPQRRLCGDAEEVLPAPPEAPWAPGPCCSDVFPKACPDMCDRKSPGACPKDPGCVGCADCGEPNRPPRIALCMITRIFDQSGNSNHLHVVGEPSGLEAVATGGRLFTGAPTTGTNASADPLFVDGHAVYSAYFEGGMGFRANKTTDVPTGDEPETLYMVTSGEHYNDKCCFDCMPLPALTPSHLRSLIVNIVLVATRQTVTPRSGFGPTPPTT